MLLRWAGGAGCRSLSPRSLIPVLQAPCASIRAMKLALIPSFLAVSVAVAAVTVGAQAPQAPNSGVQVAVPQGNAQDQANAATRQQQQQQANARLANQPTPRTADGHIVLG